MPKIVDPEQRRTEIVMALWQVIHERGIDGVTLRVVADAADISVGRLQHYFPSKAELILHGCRQMVAAAVHDHGPPEQPVDPPAAHEAIVDLLCAPLPRDEGSRIGAAVWTAYVSAAASDPAIAEIVAGAMSGRVSALAALLTAPRATAAGPVTAAACGGDENNDDDDKVDALRLAAMSEGFTQRVLTGGLTPTRAGELLRREVDRCLAGEPAPAHP